MGLVLWNRCDRCGAFGALGERHEKRSARSRAEHGRKDCFYLKLLILSVLNPVFFVGPEGRRQLATRFS